MKESSAVDEETLRCTTEWAVGLDYVTAEARGKHTTDRSDNAAAGVLITPNAHGVYLLDFLE